MVDATIGQGGHSLLFGRTLKQLIGFDVDKNSIRQARLNLEALSCDVVLINKNFSEIEQQFKKKFPFKADLILADLGFCSAQLDDPDIGLSFRQSSPLDMRIDKRIKTTAADIVNNMDQDSLADLIYNYGEDKASRRIARFIAEFRKNQPILTTGQLALIVCRALGRSGGRIHPATRTFQALRIAVNNELENLKQLLEAAPRLLNKNGYIAVISFHSLEDRIVKMDFRDKKQKGVYRCLTKKPVTALQDEKEKNRRARSAKLRISQRL